MPTSTYAFRDRWHVAAPRTAVHDVLSDVERYPQWWRQVVAVGLLAPGRGLVLCRSALPYTLELVLTERVNAPDRLEVEVHGDLTGLVAFDLEATDHGTRVGFTQEVDAHGWLAKLSPVARPLLRWNHEQMMRGCRSGLARRVAQA